MRARQFWTLLSIVVFSLAYSMSSEGAVGRTSGSYEVTPSGSSRYTIPIWAPPASGGLAPQLAIDYHQGRDNGIVGMGFQITGFSVISRCVKTHVQDGLAAPIRLTSEDVYCLDGDRLRLTSAPGTYGLAGSTYRTEIDRVAKVVAFGGSAAYGPSYFEVWQKDGLIYEYGNSDSTSGDALITTFDGTIGHSWALNAIRDRTGNRIDFSYLDDMTSGVFRPNDVKYTTNAGASLSTAPYRVLFVYEDLNRPDPIVGFHSFGGPAIENKRLDRIEVQHNTSVIKIYKFFYQTGAGGQSRVEKIRECTTIIDDDHCLAYTNFEWTNATASYQTEQSLPAGIPRTCISSISTVTGVMTSFTFPLQHRAARGVSARRLQVAVTTTRYQLVLQTRTIRLPCRWNGMATGGPTSSFPIPSRARSSGTLCDQTGLALMPCITAASTPSIPGIRVRTT